jgi:hypothetical protein
MPADETPATWWGAAIIGGNDFTRMRLRWRKALEPPPRKRWNRAADEASVQPGP